MVVDGDHRVAVMANQELRAGDELFYDYNYDKIVAPDWAQAAALAKEVAAAAAAAAAAAGDGGKRGGRSGRRGRGRGRGRGII